MTDDQNETRRSRPHDEKAVSFSKGESPKTNPTDAHNTEETTDLGTVFSKTRRDAVPEAVPEWIGRYRVEKVLGKGGYGCVYLAYDDELQRNVTIKVPHGHRIKSSQDVDAFLTEARTLAKLEHPNVVPVHDVGNTPEGVCFVVSRYIDGSDLHQRMRSSPLSIGESVELVATIAEALHYVHAQGVIHRDIKPSNILLDKRGSAYLADFGLALLEDEAAKSNSVAGTPSYMSPEQARGENHLVEGTSDIFSLGVVLYEMITGTRLFKGENGYATLRLVQEQEARPLREINRDIPAELERICMKAISKRASDRHGTALDFAEDLRHFLGEDQGLHIVSGELPVDVGSVESKAASSRQFLGIVPKGLRSFGPEDAHFFLGLLPGPYDRSGTPESILFWKRRIEELDPQNSFRVGLIYGPSGCGKSSFVKAGLVPTLSRDVTSIFVEAAPDATETRLLHRLRRTCPYLDTDLGLRESIASLRHGQVMGEGKKVLIVIDQFEQWLYSVEQPEHSELAKALRQCDGEHVQCLLLVRDDFWLAFSRFMDHLEVELLQNKNMALVDLFDPLHARRVLAEFGRAFNRLPEHYSDSTRDQRAFISQAVDEISENGKVTPVRLALLAEMIKGKPWSTSTLRKIGGTAGIGVMFLDENFVSESAPAGYRVHQKAVYATLSQLLPQPGADLKGHMRSREELLEASGYADRPKEFQSMMRALDSELHLVTRTDPEGHGDDMSGGGSGSQSGSMSSSLSQNCYYQLAHDYLVPSIRAWQARMQRETRKGRAEIRLAERAEIWGTRPESRHLPTWPEWVSIIALTPRDRWNDGQRRMMKSATRRHLSTTFVVTLAAIVAGGGLYQYMRWNQASSLTSQLATANVAQVSGLLDQLDGYKRWTAGPLREIQAASSPDSHSHLFSSLALLRSGSGGLDDVSSSLLTANPDVLVLLSEELRPQSEQLKPQLWNELTDESTSGETDTAGRPFHRRFNAALVLAGYDPPAPTPSPQDTAPAVGPVGSEWDAHAEFITDQLLYFANIDRQYYPSLLKLIRPAAPALVNHLSKVMVDPKEKELRRSAAETLLTDLLRDTPVQLTDRYLIAGTDQIQPVLPLIDASRTTVRPLLDREVTTVLDMENPDWQESARRKSMAAALLLRQGASNEEIWSVLKTDGIPDARTLLVQRVQPIGVNPQLIAERLQVEEDNSIRCGLIQALGEYQPSDLTDDLRNRTITQVKGLFSTARQASLRSNALWLLRRWGQDSWVQDRLGNPVAEDSARDWYVDSHGFTMVRLPPPQPQYKYLLDAATAEVTVKQFARHRPDIELGVETAPTVDCPLTHPTFHEAVAYCNWLTLQSGLGEDQLCYPDREGEHGPAVNLYPDYQRRSGYRLATVEEWFHMYYGGSKTDYSFGHDPDLVDGYATFVDIGRRGWPVGKSKPNDYGIFDMITSVREWVSDSDPKDPVRRGLCGQAFRQPKSGLEPARIGFDVPDLNYSFQGFRVVRSRPIEKQ